VSSNRLLALKALVLIPTRAASRIDPSAESTRRWTIRRGATCARPA
jgi:hypothetical protein